MAIKAYIDDEKTIRVTGAGSNAAITVPDGQDYSVEDKGQGNYLVRFSVSLSLDKPYTLTVSGETVKASPLGVLKGAFDARFGYAGSLGNFTVAGVTMFRLWAPMAGDVLINIYASGSGDELTDAKAVPMKRNGSVWEYSCDGLTGKYYTYTVDGAETVDPYAHTAGINGQRGMILDFSAPEITPDGWASEHEDYRRAHGLASYTDAVIWETHVRDFSRGISASQHKGKYLAFTEKLTNEFGQPVGAAYIKNLGVTHVHLLPIAEYATVDQTRMDDEGYNAFNWGYDPFSHNIPSGVYSENPYDGAARVREVREMVAALHAEGIGVVLDVVYNHTYNFDCPLGRVFKEYYYRRDQSGNYTNGSGCGNELASERRMCRKYIVDSLKFWAKEYHIDGFRFDLMGVHDLETMREVEKELREINPDIILYGEGWTGGASPLPAGYSASRNNVTRGEPLGVPGVAVFSDIIRDSIKGEVFIESEGGYVNGRAWENVEKIKFSVMGGTSPNFNMGWVAASAASVVNYVSAHDNHTLWDKIYLTGTLRTFEHRMRLNKMAAAVYMTSQGVPFMQSGEEMLRSKPSGGGFDHNSYKSPDDVNNIRWSRLRTGAAALEMSDYYKGLIAVRKAHPAMRLSDPGEIEEAIEFIDIADKYEVITYTLSAKGDSLYIVYNPLTDTEVTLPAGMWGLLVNGDRAGVEPASVHSGKVTIKAECVYVFSKVN